VKDSASNSKTSDAGARPGIWWRLLRAFGPAALVCAVTAGCYRSDDMAIQPKYWKVYRPTDFFADGESARPLPPGVVPHGDARTDREYFFAHVQSDPTGKTLIDHFPVAFLPKADDPDPRATLLAKIERGQQRFGIFCVECHGALGYGDGMIVRRGFPSPPSYHSDRLLHHEPIGHFFDVITRGWGAMYGFSSRISPEDRWCIVAYIKTLQMSQNADPQTVASANALVSPDEQDAAKSPTGLHPSAIDGGAQ